MSFVDLKHVRTSQRFFHHDLILSLGKVVCWLTHFIASFSLVAAILGVFSISIYL